MNSYTTNIYKKILAYSTQFYWLNLYFCNLKNRLIIHPRTIVLEYHGSAKYLYARAGNPKNLSSGELKGYYKKESTEGE